MRGLDALSLLNATAPQIYMAFLGALAEPRQRVLPPELPEIDAEPVSGEPRQPVGR